MSDQLPPPLVPEGMSLRDFPRMMVDVKRLRDSNFGAAVSGEEFRCGVFLWCAAWHQTPAGSLPDDDVQLASLAGLGRGLREWRKVRQNALYGWIKCSDGRLYHPVVCEMAHEAQKSRYEHWYMVECGRIKKAAQRAKTDAIYPTLDQWVINYLGTGSKRWEPNSTSECPAPVPGTSPASPGEIASKVRDGKGREGRALKALSSNNAAILENPEQVERVVSALREYGYEVNSETPEAQRLAAIGAKNSEITEACNAAKPASWNPVGRTKPIAWVLSRIEGRRGDSPTQGEATPVQVDPAIAAKQAADRKLEDALIDARQLASTSIITPEQRAERERNARAAHTLAMQALGAVS